MLKTPQKLTKNERNTFKNIRKAIDDESVSYDEILFLSEHQEKVKEYGDIVLAEWAGVPEQEWMEL